MNTVGFECEHCHHRLSVPAELAGRAVRCPKCQSVVTAPAAAPVPIVPDLSGAARRAAEVESIFSNPEDDDGDSLFAGLAEARKPIIPHSDPSQPTIRIPGIPPPSPAATEGVVTVVDMPAPRAAPVVPAELPNPFRRMVDEVVAEPDEPDGSVEQEPLAAAPGWMKWALPAVSVYAMAMTVLAVWALTRPPVEKVIEKPIPIPRK